MKTLKCKDPVLIAGDNKETYSVATCMLQAGYNVTLYTSDTESAIELTQKHFSDLSKIPGIKLNWDDFNLVSSLPVTGDYCFGLIVCEENEEKKKDLIRKLEHVFSDKPDYFIGVNTETISLNDLHQGFQKPENIIGINWVEPAHITQFLEIISNDKVHPQILDRVKNIAIEKWQKDPYIVTDLSIRARLLAAMIREANFLIENKYASIEDIDRACRNDAGYYLPFAGNFRYMDLMGTNAYGLVMNDINPELSKDTQVPSFFKEVVQKGHLGMENNKGFYNYKEGDKEKWDAVFRKFSYQIQGIINKYPFNYLDENNINGHHSD